MSRNIFSKAREGAKETEKQVISKTAELLNAAFALVAALAWNEAVKALIDKFFPSGSGVYSKFAYALIVTVIVVIITTRLAKYAEKKE